MICLLNKNTSLEIISSDNNSQVEDLKKYIV